jgi:hypothetical protein
MSDQLYALLLGSIQLAAARKRIAALEAENAKLKWQVRLAVDMRRDLTEFELSAEGPFLAPPFRRQAD